jgi:hypothetical protein
LAVVFFVPFLVAFFSAAFFTAFLVGRFLAAAFFFAIAMSSLKCLGFLVKA